MVKRSLDTFAVKLSAHSEGFDGLVRRMGYMALLPLLEFPYGEVSERLVTALTNAGVPESQAQMVSLRELVKFALQRGSSYWAGLAVGWLEMASASTGSLPRLCTAGLRIREGGPSKYGTKPSA